MRREPTPRTDVGRSTVEKKKYRTRGGKGGALSDQQVCWYEQKPESLWEYTLARCKTIKQKQIRRRYELAVYQNFYCNFESYFSGNLYSPGGPSGWMSPHHRLSFNVIKSCTDTATARIAKDKPRVMAIPNSSDQRIITKAEKQTQFLDGVAVASDLHNVAEDVFRDGCIYGDGYLWLREKQGQIACEVAKVDEVRIDPIDGMKNDPLEIHLQIPTPRTELLARYGDLPGAAEAIEQAKGSWRGDMTFMAIADMVEVTYSWRKKSHEKAKDGRFAVCIDGMTLEQGEWKYDWLPIMRWQWTPPTYGPFGQGIAHELEGRQLAIGAIMRSVMTSIHLFAIPRVWLEKTSAVPQDTITNEEGTANYYEGKEPIFSTPAAAAPDVYQFLQWLISDAFKQVGLSQMTAQSEKPAGLNAAVAMRTYQDVETQRFAIVGQRWERFFCQIAEAMLDMAAEIYGKTKKYSVNAPGRSFLQTVDWKDIGLKRDQYELQAFPTSIMPRTPEGQLQTAQELTQSGFMPEDVVLSQMRIPNLNAWIEEKTASRDNINMCLSRIRDKGKYVAPNGIADMDLCVSMAMSAWLRADLDDDFPPERADLLLRFLNEAQQKQAAIKAASQPQAPPAGGAPGAPGGAIVGQPAAPPQAPMAPAGSGPVTAAAA